MISPNDEIVIKNIINCSADAAISSAERNLFISELILEQSDFRKTLSDIKNDIVAKYAQLQEHRKNMDAEISLAESISEKLYICRELLKKTKTPGTHAQALKKTAEARIALWYSNPYAKDAYSRFSRLFEHCEEFPVDSFNAVCESVDESATFGIIPISNSSDGRLMSFYRMIDKFDLKISAVCKIEAHDGNSFTKYALVSRKPVDFDSENIKCIEFSTNKNIAEIICFLELLDCKIGDVSSISSLYGENEYNSFVSAFVEPGKIKEFMLYTYLFVGDIDFIGIYIEI